MRVFHFQVLEIFLKGLIVCCASFPSVATGVDPWSGHFTKCIFPFYKYFWSIFHSP